jgi:zinc protease
MAIATYKARARSAIATKGYDPDEAFQDTIRVTMAQHDPTVTMTPQAILDAMDANKSLAVFRDRFADMSDFRFVIVGNFSLDSIAPLVTRYLGALPGGGRKERFVDPGIRPPSGMMRKTVSGGTEPRTVTVLEFHGAIDPTRENQWNVHALADVLQLRLMERLRQQMSGTYSVQVQADVSRIPTPQYSIIINFVSAPERAEELTRATLAVLDSAQRVPARDADVQKVRESQRLAFEEAQKTDGFWLSRIALYDELGLPFSDITVDRILQTWTGADVQAAAKQYLDLRHYIHFALVPDSRPVGQ